MAKEVLGNKHKKNKPWVTDEVLEMCEVKEKQSKITLEQWYNIYRDTSKKVHQGMKDTKQKWLGDQYTRTKGSLWKQQIT